VSNFKRQIERAQLEQLTLMNTALKQQNTEFQQALAQLGQQRDMFMRLIIWAMQQGFKFEGDVNDLTSLNQQTFNFSANNGRFSAKPALSMPVVDAEDEPVETANDNTCEAKAETNLVVLK
jgi:hypothetical protein